MKVARIYYCDDYSFDYESLSLLLPEERFARYSSLRFEKDRKNCVGAYLLLLKGMKEYGVSDFRLKYTETGKPYAEDAPVFFNMSHCKNGFACAFSENEIGVDIQEIITPKDLTLKKVCTENEKKAIAGSDIVFTKLWTLKESIIKKEALTLSAYGRYEFSCSENDFYAYGNHFVSLQEKGFVITVCGEFDKAEFIKIKSTEL